MGARCGLEYDGIRRELSGLTGAESEYFFETAYVLERPVHEVAAGGRRGFGHHLALRGELRSELLP